MQNFTADVQACNRMWNARQAAGWDFCPEYGWAAPCGTTESDWEHVHGWPFPEDPEFAAFIAAREAR